MKISLHQKYNSFEFQIPNKTKIYFIYGLDTLITNHKQKVMNVSRNHTVSLFCASQVSIHLEIHYLYFYITLSKNSIIIQIYYVNNYEQSAVLWLLRARLIIFGKSKYVLDNCVYKMHFLTEKPITNLRYTLTCGKAFSVNYPPYFPINRWSNNR